jgi:hypothetical protein
MMRTNGSVTGSGAVGPRRVLVKCFCTAQEPLLPGLLQIHNTSVIDLKDVPEGSLGPFSPLP